MECGETDLARMLRATRATKGGAKVAAGTGAGVDMNMVRYYFSQMLRAVQPIHDQAIVVSLKRESVWG